mmetsp:Transcript_11360/g.24486  ORF Transcript_11360/g.24486 Transcript_11360/m.24486 type:complete len:94 (+) Transcript_11360:513-794(+)
MLMLELLLSWKRTVWAAVIKVRMSPCKAKHTSDVSTGGGCALCDCENCRRVGAWKRKMQVYSEYAKNPVTLSATKSCESPREERRRWLRITCG